MQFHQLQSIRMRRKKRVGRGGKRGTTSGRGTKGQKSRAGRKIRPQERDLIIRIPKKRGFRNAVIWQKARVIHLGAIEKLAASRTTNGDISLNTLRNAGLIPRRYRGPIKVLGGEAITVPIVLRGLKVSSSVREKIERAGGKIVNEKTK